MIGMMIMTVYNLTDTFWIGALHNRSMTAAIGVVFAFVSLVQAAGFWFGYGSGNVMSRALGAGKERDAEVYAGTGVVLSIASGLLLMLISLLFLKPLALLLGAGASESLLSYTLSYLRIMLLAIPFSLFSTTVYNQLRLCGNVRDAMLGMLTGILANIVLDPLFILALRMGVAGAGIATLIGQAASSVSLIVISGKHGNIPVDPRKCELKKERVYHILAGGSPNFTRQGITSLASVLLNHAAASFGESLLAALTVSTRVSSIVFMLAIGFGQGFQPICAMNYGAKKYARVLKAYRLTMVIGTAMLCAGTILYAITAPRLVSMFTDDAQVITLGTTILRWQCTTMPLLGIYAYASMFMQNIGRYMTALVVSVTRQGIAFIPLILILPRLLGETGIFIVQPAADLVSVTIAILLVFRYIFTAPEFRDLARK